MNVLQGSCPLCNANVTGNDSLKYYCRRCNIMFEKKHLTKEKQNVCMKGIGLFIGRFQPFHAGHLWAVKELLKECDGIIIGIGSSEQNNTRVDPFTFDERKAMIEETFKDHTIRHYEIKAVPDINNDRLWAQHVKEIIGEYDFIYTGSELTKNLFLMEGDTVIELPRHEEISATEVRLRIAKGLKFQHLLTKGTLRILEEKEGVKRIKGLE